MRAYQKGGQVIVLVLVFLIVGAISAFAGSIKIITNTSVASGTVDAETVKKIYSGHMTQWPDNTPIVLAVTEDAPYHKAFLKEYVRKSTSQFKTTWKKMVFTGRGSYPNKFDSEEDLIAFVAKTQGAIGYVDAASNPEGVNVSE